MFPIWLKIIIIFYFLSGYWLGKLINTFYYGDYVKITHFIPLHYIFFNRKLIELYITKQNYNLTEKPVITF